MPHPNPYVKLLQQEFSDWTFTEENAPLQRGSWRQAVFAVDAKAPLDLEIGTGNGYHFAHRAGLAPERQLVGLELKYKPLIQSIRRAIKLGATNGRLVRYNAHALEDIFASGELNNVYIHFPDPWPRKAKWKNRLIQAGFLESLYELQQPGGEVEFKTDSQCYFDYALERMSASSYKILELSRNLHESQYREKNFITQFEALFLRQDLPIYYVRLLKESVGEERLS